MSNSGQTLITTAEVADRLGCNVRTVHRLVTAGRITPAAKTPGIRGAYLFRDEEIERYQRERFATAA